MCTNTRHMAITTQWNTPTLNPRVRRIDRGIIAYAAAKRANIAINVSSVMIFPLGGDHWVHCDGAIDQFWSVVTSSHCRCAIRTSLYRSASILQDCLRRIARSLQSMHDPSMLILHWCLSSFRWESLRMLGWCLPGLAEPYRWWNNCCGVFSTYHSCKG